MLPLWIFSQLMLIGILQTGAAIYRGQLVSSSQRREFPYMVAIVDATYSQKYHCGGAIIDASHILTAAHCVFWSLKEKITVISGVVDRESLNSLRSSVVRIHVPMNFEVHGRRCGKRNRIQGWFRDAWDYIINEKNDCLVHNDIAVLTLSKALPLNENIKAVNLPDSDVLLHCQFFKLAGWGQTEKDGPPSVHLYWTYMMIAETPNHTSTSSSEFWVMDPMLETCSLKGDSGVPLVFNNTVIGVDSHGSGDPARPTAFAKVFNHMKFILKALQN